jgi:hypothetical protein
LGWLGIPDTSGQNPQDIFLQSRYFLNLNMPGSHSKKTGIGITKDARNTNI